MNRNHIINWSSLVSMDHFTLVANMEKEEFRILNAIEIGMRKFKTVPFTNIAFYARYDPEEVQHWLDKVHKRDIIIRESGKRQRYVLNSKGYDLLALRALAERDVVASIGNMMGVGKESDVYQALATNEARLALKFHRIGRTSFRAIKQKRDYARGKHHVSWLYMCRLSATREAENLATLNDIGAPVPVLVDQNRHVVVMELFQGQELHDFTRVDDPADIFDKIVAAVSLAFRKAGLIHCDLCEFNIVLTVDGDVLIIDWPQAVSIDHPNAHGFLQRDLENVCVYFEKKHGLVRDPAELMQEILPRESTTTD
ncbi:serine/threonine protein phosphatase [Candidatus Bathyarchaeota archaeon]|nr:serine/threonine protein phosphatase [Candidatus Bathyarchaeota archaeon]